jgi:hypothetical protein
VFSSGKLVSTAGNVAVNISSCSFSTFGSTSLSGENGVLFGMPDASYAAVVYITDTVISNISAPSVTKGAFISLLSTTSNVTLENISGMKG